MTSQLCNACTSVHHVSICTCSTQHAQRRCVVQPSAVLLTPVFKGMSDCDVGVRTLTPTSAGNGVAAIPRISETEMWSVHTVLHVPPQSQQLHMFRACPVLMSDTRPDALNFYVIIWKKEIDLTAPSMTGGESCKMRQKQGVQSTFYFKNLQFIYFVSNSARCVH